MVTAMQQHARYRLAVDVPLSPGAILTLEGNPAHYLATVLRLGVGDRIGLFNRTEGEWVAVITEIHKRAVVVQVEVCTRPVGEKVALTVCFAPIKGGRLETIIEKATELGASVLQPVITQRTIVDKVNLDRAYAIAREAAEQCERVDWPEIRQPVKLAALLASWPKEVSLIYGDESGGSGSVVEILAHPPSLRGGEADVAIQRPETAASGLPRFAGNDGGCANKWAILVGPEGGFTPEELALLTRIPAAIGVGLGPRILRADTAVITLCTLTLAAWGDWEQRPRFAPDDKRVS